MSIYSKVIGEISPQNPVGDADHSDRVESIKAHFANDSITKEQFDDLMGDEASTLNYIRLKRLGAAVLLATIGFFILL